MQKTKRKYILIIILLISILIFLFAIFSKDKFDTKISLKFEEMSAELIDEIVSQNIFKELKNSKKLKNIQIITLDNYCNIYLKAKENILEALSKIESVLSISYLNPEKNYDFKYNILYNYYVVLFSDIDLISSEINNSYLNNLIHSKHISKVLDFQKDEFINTIYYKDSDLSNYNTTPSEIKNIIKDNNKNENLVKNSNAEINSNINSIEDIGNLSLPFKDKDFSNNFKNVFEIKEEFKKDYEVKFNNKNAKIIALNKKFYYPEFLLKLKLEKISKNLPNHIKYKLIKTSSLNRYEPKNKNDIPKDSLVFINCDHPRISKKDLYENINNGNFIVLTYRKYLFNKKSLKNLRKTIVSYNINTQDLNSYELNKSEVVENIKANNDGLHCSDYFNKGTKIKIYLKNKAKSNLIYSKQYKNFIDYSEFLKEELKDIKQIIIRK